MRRSPQGRSRSIQAGQRELTLWELCTRVDQAPHPGQTAPAVVQGAATRTISIFTSTDSTATSAIDGNNSSFSRSTTTSTDRTASPAASMTAHFRATSMPP